MKTIVENKQVLFGPTKRWIFSNPRNHLQVGVLTCKQEKLFLSLPVEGMGGMQIECIGFSKAWRIANRECYRRGKLFNRLVTYPLLFLKGKVH